ncbi:hypothetical protein PJI17_31955, partial [Mycobacterium kansasii]
SSATEPTFADSDVSEEGDDGGNLCPIIQEKDFLHKSKRKSSETGLYILDLIDRHSIEPDQEIYNRLLKKCTQMGKLKEGRIIHTHFLKS